MVVSLSEKILLLGVTQLHLLRETLQARDVTNSLGLRGERNVFFYLLKRKNTIKAGGSTANKMSTGWMDGWIPLRLLRLLEHLAVLLRSRRSHLDRGHLELLQLLLADASLFQDLVHSLLRQFSSL